MAPAARYEPMLAALADEIPGGEEWLHEVKWDGYRVLARVSADGVELWSRRGNDYADRFGAMSEPLRRSVAAGNCVLDGEVCALDERGRPRFGLLQAGAGELVLVVFDLLELDGAPLLDRPLAARRAELDRVLAPVDARIRLSPAYDDGDALLALAREQGLEGVIAKRRASRYLPGRRTRDWRKIKVRARETFAVAGYTHGEGGRARLGSLVLAARAGDELVYVGHVGSGLTEEAIDDLLDRLGPLRRAAPALARPPRDPRLRRGRVVWVEPRLRTRVEFTEWTADGRVRAPVYQGLCREPGGVVERPPAAEAPQSEPAPAPPRTASFGNLERVLFPEDGLTKADLLAYYRSVAPVLLPHLHDRPFTMRRAPEGIAGSFFFQKDAPEHMPEWIDRAEVPAESRRATAKPTITFPVVGDVPSLLWMVSIGCIDLHVPLSRLAAYEQPDCVLFDLDPSPGVGFPTVVRVAHHLRDALAGLGLDAYAKTSGKEGLHLCVPIAAGVGYDETRAFAHAVATAVERAYPDEATARWTKERRRGVFIDWKQNALGATIVPPYSARPTAGAPVSCPLRWDELDETLDPRAFTIATVPARVAEVGDLFAPVLDGRQDLRPFIAALGPGARAPDDR